jgi:hypothetical protein
MGMLEVAYEIRDYADYVVASENLGWSVFAYGQYVDHLTEYTTPLQLAQGIAGDYMDALHNYPATISALDMSQVANVASAVDALGTALINYVYGGNMDQAIGVRDNVQTFDSRDYLTLSNDDEYVDLYHLAALYKLIMPDVAVQSAAQGVMDAVDNCVVAEHHQSGRDVWSRNYWLLDDAHGIAIYYPPRSMGWDYIPYIGGSRWELGGDTTWNEYLLHYFAVTGLPPEPLPRREDPGIPLMQRVQNYVFLPVVIRND